MALQMIDLTTPQPGGKFGDPTKTAWEKVNDNSDYLEERLQQLAIGAGDGSEALGAIQELQDSIDVIGGTASAAVPRSEIASATGASLVGTPWGGSLLELLLFVTPEVYGAANDNTTDDTAALVAAINSGIPVQLARGAGYRIPANLTIAGRNSLSITGPGRLSLAPGVVVEFVDCLGDMVWDTSAVGNNLPVANVQSFSESGGTVSITIGAATAVPEGFYADTVPYRVGDSVQAIRVMPDGAEGVAWRGKVTGRSGDTLTCTTDTTLGGAVSLLAVGQKFVVDASETHYTTLRFRGCHGVSVSGYFECGLNFNNCTNYNARGVRSYKAGMTANFCYGGNTDGYTSELANYYGFGTFGCRALRISNVKCDRSGVGGVVTKNTWEVKFNGLDVCRARCYGHQIRDNDGTVPSVINSNLQSTKDNSAAVVINGLSIVDCNLGLWIDSTCDNVDIQQASIRGTISGASLLYDGGHNVNFGTLEVLDHFVHGAPTAYSASNSPIRIAGGNGLHIAQLVAKGCLHTGFLVNSTGSAHRGFVVEDGDVEDCLGGIHLGSMVDPRITIRAREPRANIGAWITLSATIGAIIRGCTYESANFKCSSFVSVSGASRDCSVRDCTTRSGVITASLYLDAAGENIRVEDNTFLADSTYGCTLRGSTSGLIVDRNFVRNAGTSYHSTSLTSTDHLVRGMPIVGRGSFEAKTLTAGQRDYVEVTMPGLSYTSTYEMTLANLGTAAGINYWAAPSTTGVVRVWRQNGSGADVALPVSPVKVTASFVL